jgi:hypothetical protein
LGPHGAVFKGEFGAGFSIAHRLDAAMPLAITFGYANAAAEVMAVASA